MAALIGAKRKHGGDQPAPPPPTTTTSTAKTLVVWDFDWTLINENSDTWLIKQLGGTEEYQHVMSRRKELSWTSLMAYAYERITTGTTVTGQPKCTPEDLASCIASIPVFEENLTAIRRLGATDTITQCCVSDANTVFINSYFKNKNIASDFAELHTNPASFNPDGVLEIRPYVSVDTPHECSVCASSPNMCKGAIVEDLVERLGPFERVVYLGDGRGDLCGCSKLIGKEDVILARLEYALARAIVAANSEDYCTLALWNNGKDIVRELEARHVL
jgi:pyridoxal phosphate phosphatase PHOSPHO2